MARPRERGGGAYGCAQRVLEATTLTPTRSDERSFGRMGASSGRFPRGNLTGGDRSFDLWLREQIRLAGIEVHGYRDVLLHDQPPAVDLPIHIAHPDDELRFGAVCSSEGELLNAVAIGDGTHDR